jgi:transposase
MIVRGEGRLARVPAGQQARRERHAHDDPDPAARGLGRNTVAKWRRRFEAERLDGLVDEPRPGQPRTITDAMVDEVVTRTLESALKDATHWSTRSMAAEVGLTQSAVHRIWKAFGLQPHREETFKLSRDPQFVAKVRDVVGSV